MNTKLARVFSTVLMALFLYALPSVLSAQTLDILDPASGTSDPALDYVVSTDNLVAKTDNHAGFTAGDKLYFYYVPTGQPGTTLAQSRIIGSQVTMTAPALPVSATFTGKINEIGSWDLYVGHFSGRFDFQTVLTASDVVETFGTGDNDFTYYFGGAGNRSLRTKTMSLAGETDTVVLYVSFGTLPGSLTHALQVEYSTNGTAWTVLEDENAENQIYSANNGDQEAYFGLPSGAINANTRFRIRQINGVALNSWEENFEVSSIQLLKGAPITHEASFQVYTATPSTYNVVAAPGPVAAEIPDMTITNVFKITNGTAGVVNINTADAGDTIQVELDANVDYTFTANVNRFRLVNDSYLGSEGQGGLSYTLLSATVVPTPTITPTNNKITLKALVPHNIEISDYNSWTQLTVLYLDTTVVDFGQTGAGYYDGSRDYFSNNELRAKESSSLDIQSTTGVELSFDLRRESSPIPPAGTEIVIEYSTNGTTYTSLDTVSLSEVGTNDSSFVYDALPAGIVSSTTTFRARQIDSTLLAGVHTWSIDEFTVSSPSTGARFTESNNDWWFYIFQPGFEISLDDEDIGPLYSGDNVKFIFSNVHGKFPDNTVFEITGDNDGYLAGRVSYIPANDSTFTLQTPFVEGMQYVSVIAESYEGQIASDDANFYVQMVGAEITAVSYDTPIMDGTTEYTAPGKNITVSYKRVGTIDNSITMSAELQVEAPEGSGNFMTIATQTAGATGTFTNAQLPMADLGNNPEIRVVLKASSIAQLENDYLYRGYTSAETGDFTIDGTSRFAFHVYTYAEVAQTMNIEYSTDGGSTWTVLAGTSKTVTAGSKGFTYHYAKDNYTVPVTSGEIRFRVNGGEDGVTANGNYVSINGVRLEGSRTIPDIASSGNYISLKYPTITFNDLYAENASTLFNGEFEYGKTYNIKYSTTGVWEDSVSYAFALQANNKYLVLAESNVQGTNTITFTVPSKDSLNNYFGQDDNIDMYVYAYKQSPYSDLRLDLSTITIDEWNIDVYQNGNLYNEYYYTHSGYGHDSRYFQTEAYDLSAVAGPVSLDFVYLCSITNPTLATLIRVQASTDGGVTFTDLAIDGSDVPNRLNQGGWNFASVPIPAQYLTSNTIFRWYQEIGNGTWYITFDDWWENSISKGDNEVDLYARYNAYQTLSLTDGLFDCSDYNNALSDYEFNVLDTNNQNYPSNIQPSAYAGSNFTFSYVETVNNYDSMPAGTEYSFYLLDDNGDYVTDPATGDTVVFGPYTTLNDTFTVAMPAFVETGVYDFEIVGDYAAESCGQSDYIDYDLFVINDINVVTTQLRLESPDNGDQYEVEDVFNMTYSAYGTWPSTVKFAAVLKAWTGSEYRYESLGEGTSTGVNQVLSNLNMISSPYTHDDGYLIDEYQLGIVAYEGTSPVIADVNIDLDEEDFMVSTDSYISGDNMEFYNAGDRYVVTTPQDLSGLNNVTLGFWYYADNIAVSANTLPQLLVSTDGVTFDTLEVNGAFGDRGFLGNNGWTYYSVDVPAAYATATTQFKWLQNTNGGWYNNGWQLESLEINAGQTNVYNGYQDFAWVDLTWAQLSNYAWSLEQVNGIDPTIYNGTTFDYNWDINVVMGDTMKTFPAGTTFEFGLFDGNDAIIDPATGNPIVLGTTTASTGTYTTTLPFLLDAGNYEVRATATHNGVVLEDEQVGSIRVYNDVIRTVNVANNAVIWAGDTVTFAGQLENTLNVSNLSNVYFNLIVEVDGEGKWLLDVKQGLGSNFTGVLPSFINSSDEDFWFYISASVNAPMGVVGQELTSYSTQYLGLGGNITSSTGSMGYIASNEEDLTNADILEFQIKSTKALAELQADQLAVLEYSVDGGVTYTSIATYPDARFTNPIFFENEDLNYWFNESISVPAGAKTANTILRWRVEESNGTISLNDVKILPTSVAFTVAPVSSIDTEIDVVKQRIDLTSTDAVEYCNDGTVTFNYNVRGTFGSATTYTVQHYHYENSNGWNWYTVQQNGSDLEFAGVATGTGSYAFDLTAADDFYRYQNSLGWYNGGFAGDDNEFRLVANDETYDGNEFSVYGSSNTQDVAIVAELANGYVYSNNAVSCATDDREVIIQNAQANFVYSLRNYNTGAAIGTAVTVDPNDTALTNSNNRPYWDGYNLYISIGQVTAETNVEVVAKSQSADGTLACDSIALSSIVNLDVRPSYALHYDLNGTGVWTPVAAGQSFTVCEGSSNLEFAIGYYNNNGSFIAYGDVQWYRNNNMSNVENGWYFDNFAVTGNYYAMINDDACGDITTAPVTVTVNPAPAQPAITAPASTIVCEGGSVTLTATAGYTYYEWTNDGDVVGTNSPSFTATETGVYYVRVSNVPFDQGCASNWSTPVAVTVNEFNGVWFSNTNITLCGNGAQTAEVTVHGLQDGVTYQMVNVATGANFGSAFSSSSSSATFTTPAIALSSQYKIVGTFDNNTTCTEDVNTNILTVYIAEDVVAVLNDNGFTSAAASYTGCGNDMSLSISTDANAVNWVDNVSVTWYKDGAVYNQGSQTIYPTQSGVYYARVVNNASQDLCVINTSNITVTINAAPARPTLTATGATEFCEGEGSLVLTATAGASAYHWYRYGSHIANVTTTSNTLNVTMTGEYTVVVESASGCESEESASIEAIVHATPVMPNFGVLNGGTICESGSAYVTIYNAESDVTYQLFDVTTGLASGAAKAGQDNLTLISDVLTADAVLEIRAIRIGSTCDIVSLPIEVTVNALSITAAGNVLISSITDADSYQWYRNGEQVINGGTSKTLKIYDTEEYTLVVEIGDCRLSSTIGQRTVKGAGVVAASKASIYPNPANEVLNVELSSAYVGDVKVEIMNSVGQLVYEVSAEKTGADFKQVINLEFLRGGVYQIRVSGADFNEVTRIIKN